MSSVAAPSQGGISNPFSLLASAGPIGADEKTLILTTIGLMLIVVIPVIAMTFMFARRYRASNTHATYAPKWASSRKIEAVVWLVPIAIVAVLGVLAWQKTHMLNPYRPLVAARTPASTQRPIDVDVIALDWKWLFIYPDQHIATVNQLVIPTGVPVSFRLTSDDVLSSFFIPQLGSQIYAMPGMQTKLHLEADRPGTFMGRDYQFSGPGYSWMQFKTVATSKKDFDRWVNEVKGSGGRLDPATLKELERPSIANPIAHYASVSPHLFAGIIHQVLAGNAPGGTVQTANGA